MSGQDLYMHYIILSFSFFLCTALILVSSISFNSNSKVRLNIGDKEGEPLDGMHLSSMHPRIHQHPDVCVFVLGKAKIS